MTDIRGKRQVRLSLDEKIAQDLDTIAKIKGISRASVVEQLVLGINDKYVGRDEKEKIN